MELKRKRYADVIAKFIKLPVVGEQQEVMFSVIEGLAEWLDNANDENNVEHRRLFEENKAKLEAGDILPAEMSAMLFSVYESTRSQHEYIMAVAKVFYAQVTKLDDLQLDVEYAKRPKDRHWAVYA